MNSVVPQNNQFLITGTLSGLGKYLFEEFGGISWTRQNLEKDKKKVKSEGVDIIIHCAFSSQKVVDSSNLYNYFSDNVLLTNELIEIPHKKFIYISTIDVYPKDNQKHNEDETIDVSKVDGIYGITKLMSEALVKQKSPNFLILRCSALLGKYSRKNSLIKMIEEEDCVLTLSGDSQMNYILHSDVADFIQQAIKDDLQGIYNVVSSKNITMQEIRKILDKKITFGNFTYDGGDTDNTKITSIFPTFKKSSLEVVVQFIAAKI